jgi:hypothetical protein
MRSVVATGSIGSEEMVVVISSTVEKMKTLPYGFRLEECKLGTHAEELSA